MKELNSKYNPKEVEDGLYDFWMENKFFEAGKDLSKKPFTIVMPPPNVTGALHLGHSLDQSIPDIIIRRKRMMGFDALYIPGMDHSGISTQAKVEEMLREKGISRYDLGREKFLEETWAFKERFATRFRQQWKAMGVSVDFTRERFTLDKELSDAVNYVFLDLYKKGKIYRGNRIINWDVQAKTALSNIEVDYKETSGKLYYLKYKLVDSEKFLVIATTRPETCFADQALMIKPSDKRYLKYKGMKVIIPSTNIAIPIITDDYVDIGFGTGVVKVTPAHDPNDFEVGKRHNLEMPLCMNEDGTMNEMAHKYENLDRFVCRKQLIDDLTNSNLVEKIEEYIHQVGYSERTNVIVEARLSLQWFVEMDDLAKKALKTKTEFIPNRFKKVYTNWLEGIQDWCISRQLWWGHRIPAWYDEKGNVLVQIDSPGDGWTQDEDVLDTWFSSALWPLSTLGWPNKTNDFKRYYPTDVIVPGYDIIFFWVARMIFQALEYTDVDPFKKVLFHGLIRDKEGRKMSKSLGNGVDPVDIIEKYGVDALRYFLTTNSSPGADMKFDIEKVESSWNFINKLWNISRFVMMNLDDTTSSDNFKTDNLIDKWIINRLNETIIEADYNYEKFEFSEVSRVLYNFIWDDFANWYLELAKVSLNNDLLKENTKKVLLHVLKSILKLIHPFIPFVTEKLYKSITDELSITISDWPVSSTIDNLVNKEFNEIKDIITKIRNLRNENNVPNSKKLVIHIEATPKWNKIFLANSSYLEKFLNTEKLVIETKTTLNEEHILLQSSNAKILVLKSNIVDEEKEKAILLKQKETLEIEIKRSESLLKNESFVKKAPKEKLVIEEEKYNSYLKQYETVLEHLKKYV